jgi:prephenate dehydrogenase
VTLIAADARRAAEGGPEDVLVTDAGSTKRRIVAEVEAHPRALAAFVGAHPIAGSERKGVAHARADLFEGRVCVLTPTARTPPERRDRARRFWELLGCRTLEMAPDDHDAALARTSHLPHAVAAALAAAVPAELLALAAGAYRDGTRVAGSDPDLWAGIFLENRRPSSTPSPDSRPSWPASGAPWRPATTPGSAAGGPRPGPAAGSSTPRPRPRRRPPSPEMT